MAGVAGPPGGPWVSTEVMGPGPGFSLAPSSIARPKHRAFSNDRSSVLDKGHDTPRYHVPISLAIFPPTLPNAVHVTDCITVNGYLLRAWRLVTLPRCIGRLSEMPVRLMEGDCTSMNSHKSYMDFVENSNVRRVFELSLPTLYWF
ncbi:hypothetical protein CBL_07245 [Carabus blaptoides fortunei]